MTKVKTADASNATVVAVETVARDATKAVTTAVVTEPMASAAAEQPTKQSDTDGVGGTREPAPTSAPSSRPRPKPLKRSRRSQAGRDRVGRSQA